MAPITAPKPPWPAADSVSVATTYKAALAEKGIIFCPISEALREHPELVKKYFGTVVPSTDNFYAALNSAVFSDGSFVYVPRGVRCPMELSTYFRINAKETGQFERTLIICDEGAYVSYLEGCTAPQRDENQLHAAVVELVAHTDATIKYSTVQNWYPGDKHGKGGIYNFVTKRGICKGDRAKITWTQVETGSAVTWKYPSCILQGNDSVGEFYSVAVTNNFQQADTGTKMIHIGKNTRSTIVSKGISAGHAQNTYRGLVSVMPGARNARNYTQCDSLLLGGHCGAHGWRAGYNCTDGVFIGDEQLASGDYSGPAGTRRVMRDARTEAAILEAIERQARKRTMLLITHRVAAAARCDCGCSTTNR